MISRLRGILIEKEAPKVMVEVAGGIGYEVEVPLTTFDQLPEVEQPVTIHTHLIIREDGQKLYGFYQACDRELFKILIKVNGVGPKIALAILSTIDPVILVNSVLNQDAAVLERVSGVGTRTAQRLLIELRDRLANWQSGTSGKNNDGAVLTEHIPANKPHAKAMEEAIGALVSLGYKPQLASRTISKIYSDNTPSETLIREALKALSGA